MEKIQETYLVKQYMKQRPLPGMNLHQSVFKTSFVYRSMSRKNLIPGIVAHPHKLFLRKLTRQYNRPSDKL
jgi:hypothetical protein